MKIVKTSIIGLVLLQYHWYSEDLYNEMEVYVTAVCKRELVDMLTLDNGKFLWIRMFYEFRSKRWEKQREKGDNIKAIVW